MSAESSLPPVYLFVWLDSVIERGESCRLPLPESDVELAGRSCFESMGKPHREMLNEC